MRVIYADPGLYSELGHHANSRRAIGDALIASGFDVQTLAFRLIEDGLRREFNAHAHFRCFTYWLSDGDPVDGWRNAYVTSAIRTEEDLNAIQGMGRNDILYFNSAQAAQCAGLINWARKTADRPIVVVEFGDDPGRVQDPKSALWRHVGSLIPQGGMPRFHMATFDPAISRIYGRVLGYPVGVLPLPQRACAKPRDRSGKKPPLTVAVLGHQRPDKGYHLMPDIAEQLAQRRPDIRLLIHNPASDSMPAVQQHLRQVAARHPSLVLDERVAGPEIWQALLDQTDLLLCPYDPVRYSMAYSAVAAEGLANAIPLVVPAKTTLAKTMADHGDPGVMFERPEPGQIVAAVEAAIDRYDVLAGRAFSASRHWAESQGGQRAAEAILNMAGVKMRLRSLKAVA